MLNVKPIEGKILFLGDTHFGLKKSSLEFFENQLVFFEKQVFPYMKKHKIKYIWQFGDFFDHRTSTDIRMIKNLRQRIFDYIQKEGIIMYSLIGNHDIYYRESRDVSLIEHFQDLYPDNFILFRDRETMQINGQDVFVLPWITNKDTLEPSELKNKDYIFGHLEIRNFTVVKGHVDGTSKLTPEFFEKAFSVKGVFSGHYHIKSTDGLIYYLGTPYQLNWSDYDEQKGFYIWDEQQNLEFFPNEYSKKFVKLKYNDEAEKPLEVSGLFEEPVFYTFDEFNQNISIIKNHDLKFFVNKAEDNKFDEYLYVLKENKINFTLINNQMVSVLIETNYVEEEGEELDTESTRDLITKTIKDNRPDLVPLINNLFTELDSVLVEVE